MFAPDQQSSEPGGMLLLHFDLPVTVHSAALENGRPVLSICLRTPDRLPHYGWLRVGEGGDAFPRGLYLPELVRTPSGKLWVCAGVEVDEKEREVLFPLGETHTSTRSHVPSQSCSALGFQQENWVRLFDKGYALDPLDPKKKRQLVKLKETPPSSAQLDALGQVHFLSGFRPLVYQDATLPELAGANFQLLATSPTLDILAGVKNRLVRYRLNQRVLTESQTLLELPEAEHTFYSIWNAQQVGPDRFLLRFTFDEGNGWALVGPEGLERSHINQDKTFILHTVDALQDQVLEVYYSRLDPHSLWLRCG